MNLKKIYPLFFCVAILLFTICSFKLKITETVNNVKNTKTKTLLIELLPTNSLDHDKGR